MRTPEPICLTEQLFIAAAARVLPVDESEIGRSDRGILYYFWKSPCHALGGLWVFVKEREIMLSTKVTHTHVDSTDFLSEGLPEVELPARIVAKGISKTRSILGGDVIFIESKWEDGSGNEGRSSGMTPRHVWEREHRRPAIYGAWEETIQGAWNWVGEVPIR